MYNEIQYLLIFLLLKILNYTAILLPILDPVFRAYLTTPPTVPQQRHIRVFAFFFCIYGFFFLSPVFAVTFYAIFLHPAWSRRQIASLVAQSPRYTAWAIGWIFGAIFFVFLFVPVKIAEGIWWLVNGIWWLSWNEGLAEGAGGDGATRIHARGRSDSVVSDLDLDA